MKVLRGVLGDEEERFLAALGTARGRAVLWLRQRGRIGDVVAPVSWQPEWVDWVEGDGLGATQEHVSGMCYMLDMSSVFAASVCSAITQRPRIVLDLCSAPGGKAAYAWRALNPELLFCNEFVDKRLAALISNIKRCQIGPAIVTSYHPRQLATTIGAVADLVLADVPCSGQSLVAKGAKHYGAFHPVTIQRCVGRQRSILLSAADMVAPGGAIAYMTCTFSPEENEEILSWFLKKHSDFEPVAFPPLAEFQSKFADFPCYRLWPQQGVGAGSFTALLRKSLIGERAELSLDHLRIAWQNLSSQI